MYTVKFRTGYSFSILGIMLLFYSNEIFLAFFFFFFKFDPGYFFHVVLILWPDLSDSLVHLWPKIIFCNLKFIETSFTICECYLKNEKYSQCYLYFWIDVGQGMLFNDRRLIGDLCDRVLVSLSFIQRF